MSFHRSCCCDAPTGVAWIVGQKCLDLSFGEKPFPVVRKSVAIAEACLLGSHVRVYNGECYIFSQTGTEVVIDGTPSGLFADAEAGTYYCNCWLCDEELDLKDPIEGDPTDGAANCCPNDLGCTTFGSNTVDTRVSISGEFSVRTKCNDGSFVTNSYSFSTDLSNSGTACDHTGGDSELQGVESWTPCIPPGFTTNPQVSYSVDWDEDNGITEATASIDNLPEVPGGFRIRIRGGNSDFVADGAGWSNYDEDEYSYNEAVVGDCETQFAAAGSLRLSLNTDDEIVTMSMRISGAVDNLGPCP